MTESLFEERQKLTGLFDKLLFDKIILYVFAAVYFFYLPIDSDTTLLCLISISSTCLINAFARSHFNFLIYAALFGNLFLACFYSTYILLLPILLYDFWFYFSAYVCLLFVVPFAGGVLKYASFDSFVLHVFQNDIVPEALVFILFLNYTFSIILSQRTKALLQSQKDLHELQDTYKEYNYRLKKENSNLVLQQNQEITIATLNERNRIAREIHDNVGHMLSRSILQVGALIAVNREETLNEPYEQLKQSLNQAMDSIRSSVHDLHNESIDVENSIRQILNNFDFCKVNFHCDISNYAPQNVKYCFISITKEALHNTVRHSHATRIEITILEHPSFYKYCYADNGGDDAKSAMQSVKKDEKQDAKQDAKRDVRREEKENVEDATPVHAGIGLLNMQERVRQLHGFIHFEKKNGFYITISIPKENR